MKFKKKGEQVMTVKALMKAGDLELRIKEPTAGEQESRSLALLYLSGPYISR